MKLVICSAGRPAMLREKTLSCLPSFSGSVLIVVPYEEVPAYAARIPEYTIVGAPRGLPQQRQFARDLYDREEEIVFMDDDITAVKAKGNYGLCPADLNLMFSKCFEMMRRAGASMWGVYPVCNRDWMKPVIDCKNAYVVGALYGIVNSIPAEGVDSEKEDWERQLKLLDVGGKVLRFRQYGIVTRYWRGDTGGIQRTVADTKRIVDSLCERYGSMVASFTRPNGQLDLKFRERPVVLSLPSLEPFQPEAESSEEDEP